MSAIDDERLPEYFDLQAALRRCGVAQGPAEVQGFALGLQCGQVSEPRRVWREELYSDLDPADVLAEECRMALDRVFDAAFQDTSDTPFELTLLLPRDIEVNSVRLGALRDWCQGFLYGFGLGGERLRHGLSAQTQELLHDITEFTRVDTENVDNSEQDQASLIEVEEYLREAVLLIRDDTQLERGGDEPK